MHPLLLFLRGGDSELVVNYTLVSVLPVMSWTMDIFTLYTAVSYAAMITVFYVCTTPVFHHPAPWFDLGPTAVCTLC